MRIGIYGGSFNPPHKGHKQIIKSLLGKYVDKIIIVPVGSKYPKHDLISNQDRYNMLKIMTSDLNNVEVSNCELKSNLVYAYQTLDYYKECYPNDQIYFICGTDNLNEIKTWNNYQYILNNYFLLVIKRVPITFNYKDYSNIIITNITVGNISSTIIRNKLKSNNIVNDLDINVLKYIKQKQLYVL